MFKQVFSTQTANGNSTSADFQGGTLEIVVTGTFGSGTVTLEANYPDVNAWVPVQGLSWTASGVQSVTLQRPCSLRLVLAGATSPSLDAWI